MTPEEKQANNIEMGGTPESEWYYYNGILFKYESDDDYHTLWYNPFTPYSHNEEWSRLDINTVEANK